MSNDRIERIYQYIEAHGEVTVDELAALFSDVSSMTIRRDLATLEERGDIVRIRGGAKSIAHLSRRKEAVFSHRAGENVTAKQTIAQKALRYVQTGRSLYLDAGSTILHLASRMGECEPSFVLTSSPVAALELIKNSSARVTLVGGQLNSDNLCVSGSNSVAFVQNINIDIAFMAASGFSTETGFTTGDFNECELKREIVSKARKKILLMDITKIDTYLPFTFAALSDIDVLVTDQPPEEEISALARECGVEII